METGNQLAAVKETFTINGNADVLNLDLQNHRKEKIYYNYSGNSSAFPLLIFQHPPCVHTRGEFKFPPQHL